MKKRRIEYDDIIMEMSRAFSFLLYDDDVDVLTSIDM